MVPKMASHYHWEICLADIDQGSAESIDVPFKKFLKLSDFESRHENLGSILYILASHTACTGFQMAKKYLLPIQCFRPSRDSQGPRTKKNQFSRGLFQKIPFLYFFLHKSWIWRTLEHVMEFFYCHFHNASKECFWPKKFKFHAQVQKCHFGKIEKLPKRHF